MMDTVPHERISELTREHIAVVAYDAQWPARYAAIEERLLRELPSGFASRIVHIGSTAVPGLSAKPIIDVQVEVAQPERTRTGVVPLMRDLGYEFIWRPTMGERASHYAWFIGRNARGERTEHIHMVEPDEASKDRILFRDFLRAHPAEAVRYEALKQQLLHAHPADRAAYTHGKTAYVRSIVQQARTLFA